MPRPLLPPDTGDAAGPGENTKKKCISKSQLPWRVRIAFAALSFAARQTGVTYFAGANVQGTLALVAGVAVGGSGLLAADPSGGQAIVFSINPELVAPGTSGVSGGLQVGAATYSTVDGFKEWSAGFELNIADGPAAGYGLNKNSSGIASYAMLGVGTPGGSFSPLAGSYGFVVRICPE